MRSVCVVLRLGYQLPEGQRYAAAPTLVSKAIAALTSTAAVTVATVPAAKPTGPRPTPA